MRFAVISLSLLLGLGPAYATCHDIAPVKAAVLKDGGRWVVVTDAQYHFLQGLYAALPTTPEGLPMGDHAALATKPGMDGGAIFFLDGDKTCYPMAAPSQLLEMLMDVGSGVVLHEGNGM